MSDIDIEIDGKPLKARPNSTVIQVADEAGIYIPRFCYHKHLSIVANCRMCLVEVEKAPKPMPACATPVMQGMKVFTQSAKALAAQRAVMEFLLINHPLDCPICDQGGECELQDISMGYGRDRSFYDEPKRAVKDEDLGPLIATDMTRCIHCTRCVRFGAEVAGLRELGAMNRGEDLSIGTFMEHSVRSVVSGNVIDLCPVGALTSKPYRFTARAWELNQYPQIAPHDCVGSNINVHVRDGKVMRVVPRENPAINETWISDRDRYSYEGLYHADRLLKPMIRVKDVWQETSWENALRVSCDGLRQIIAAKGAEQVAAVASPNATVEEFYLLQKLLRQLGSSNIDHRLRQSDFRDQEQMPLYPGVYQVLPELENHDVILLIGAEVLFDQPSIGIRLRKAALKGTKILALSMRQYPWHVDLTAQKIVAPHHLTEALANILNSQSWAEHVNKAERLGIYLGIDALNHPEAATLRHLAAELAGVHQAHLGFFTEGANSAGAWLAGAVPHRSVGGEVVAKPGLDAERMWREPRQAYLLLNVEPDFDCANPMAASEALEQAPLVIALSCFKNAVLEQYADVILPITPFAETSGTYVNVAGQWQSFKGVATPLGEARPAWKVLRVLGNFLELTGFDYTGSDAVLQELQAQVTLMTEVIQQPTVIAALQQPMPSQAADDRSKIITRIGEIPLYAADSLVRRAKSLQTMQSMILGDLSAVRLHPQTAQQLGVKEGEKVAIKQGAQRIQARVVLDETIAEHALYLPTATTLGRGLPELFGAVAVERIARDPL